MAAKRKKKVGGLKAAVLHDADQQRRRDEYARIEAARLEAANKDIVRCKGSGVLVDVRLVCAECGYHPGLAPTQHAATCPRW